MPITKNIFYNLLSQLPQVFSGLVVSVLSTRILGPEGKGVFGIITYDILFLGLLLSLGVNMATGYFIASKKTTAPEILGLGIYHLLANSVLLTLFLASMYLSGNAEGLLPTDQSVVLIYAYIIGGFALNYVNSIVNAIFQGSKKFRYINRSFLLKAFSNLALFGGLYIYHLSTSVGLEAVILVSIALIVIQTMYWLVSYAIEFGQPPIMKGVLKQQFNLLLSFSLIGYFSNLLNFLNYRLDIYIVEAYTTIDQVGFYILAVNLTQMLWLISDPIAGILKPYLSDPNAEKSRQIIFGIYQRLNASVILIVSLGAWLLAELVIPLLYGQEFYASIIPFRILLIGNFFACNSKVFGVFNFVTDNIKYNLQATAIGLIFTVIFDFLLIPSYGISGAAWASNAAYLTIFAYLVFITRWKLNLRINNLFIFTPSDYHQLKNE